MRRRSAFGSLLCLGLLASSSQAQTGDCQAVKDIPPGSYISVKIQRHKVRCFFSNATDTELFCLEQSLRKVYPSREPVVHNYDLDRQSIHQVRPEHPVKSAFLGAAIGTGIGIGVGAVLANGPKPDPEARVYYPMFFGITSGFVSAKIMGHISVLHGKVVYER